MHQILCCRYESVAALRGYRYLIFCLQNEKRRRQTIALCIFHCVRRNGLLFHIKFDLNISFQDYLRGQWKYIR